MAIQTVPLLLLQSRTMVGEFMNIPRIEYPDGVHTSIAISWQFRWQSIGWWEGHTLAIATRGRPSTLLRPASPALRR